MKYKAKHIHLHFPIFIFQNGQNFHFFEYSLIQCEGSLSNHEMKVLDEAEYNKKDDEDDK